MRQVRLDEETRQDLINIGTGLLSPLEGFMSHADYRACVDSMCLRDGRTVWTIPITLDVDEATYAELRHGGTLELLDADGPMAVLDVEDCLSVVEEDFLKVFKTLEDAHPGVAKERRRSPYRAGGRLRDIRPGLLDGALHPEQTMADFHKNGWQTVVGFQTRNPIHNAHEHLQRVGLEHCDALFINPIVGWKKKGDFTEEAVVAGYRRMIDEFYPKDKIYFAGLKTQMRYAGPREAVFHATIRRNLGCTHFIVGRDHAGVGGYYGMYEAHELVRQLSARYDLGIEVFLFHEPYYCRKCGFVVSHQTCAHEETHKVEISGTIIRECMDNRTIPDSIYMRPEISEEILKLDRIFI